MSTISTALSILCLAPFLGGYLGAFSGTARLQASGPTSSSVGRVVGDALVCDCIVSVPWVTYLLSFGAGAVATGIVTLGLHCGFCRTRWQVASASEGGVSLGAPAARPQLAQFSGTSSSTVPHSTPSSVLSAASSVVSAIGNGGGDTLAVWAPRRRPRAA